MVAVVRGGWRRGGGVWERVKSAYVTLNVGPMLVGQADILESLSLLTITAEKAKSYTVTNGRDAQN